MDVKKNNGLVVMDNKLIRASYKLTVNEIRLILVAISQMPKNDEPVDPKKAYYITKNDFVRLGVEPKNVARDIRSACKDLLSRVITIKTPIGDLDTHWVHNVLHFKSEVFERLKKEYPDAESDEEFISSLRLHNLMDSLPMIANSDDNLIARVVLHEDIIPYISQLREQFTQLMLDDVVDFGSFYSYRVYLMMMQFRSTGICTIKINDLREALDLKDKYEATKDLKVRVIDTAVDEINEKSPFNVTYEMTKTGRKFTHLVLKFKPKKKNAITAKDVFRDPDTVDMFTVDGLNDKQLGRIARNPAFIAEYNHLVSPTSPAGQSQQGWEFEMVNRLKNDPTQFNKRPIREYLEY
ncbi:replication initiation protein [Psychrobacter celer]|uniref:replication initiation protein n=1 Tax=Psychrobacter celer TaxID=306572 RepID=UPI003FD5A9DA